MFRGTRIISDIIVGMRLRNVNMTEKWNESEVAYHGRCPKHMKGKNAGNTLTNQTAYGMPEWHPRAM